MECCANSSFSVFFTGTDFTEISDINDQELKTWAQSYGKNVGDDDKRIFILGQFNQFNQVNEEMVIKENIKGRFCYYVDLPDLIDVTARINKKFMIMVR
ncbi:7173_t:CDS:2, partial [Scutellospora calospora]